GRQRTASSGSSEAEPEPEQSPEREQGPEPAPCPGSPSERDPPRAAGPAGTARGQRPAGKGLLSFGSEEEREGEESSVCEEFFKVKKPSFNEVTFRIQKKENLLPAQTEAEESKKICQLEPGIGNTKGTCDEKNEEKEDASYSSLNEEYSSSDSENESSSPQRGKDLSPGDIPSAAHAEAARRKRHLARAEADFLPLDISNSHQVSRGRRSSDLESEDESETKSLDFAPKMTTLRQRMTEEMGEFVLFLPGVL
ncbi:GCFC2 factor, partial [Xiphorhynchus elegans]|nr:GCFC2 factor [Xiphorhynchus elegans]